MGRAGKKTRLRHAVVQQSRHGCGEQEAQAKTRSRNVVEMTDLRSVWIDGSVPIFKKIIFSMMVIRVETRTKTNLCPALLLVSAVAGTDPVHQATSAHVGGLRDRRVAVSPHEVIGSEGPQTCRPLNLKPLMSGPNG